jgi:[acyl-carrier-protein] S-malonyltransferase
LPAFVFPGQGSQRHGMGQPWQNHPSWEVVEDASAAAGRDVGRLLLESPVEELTETRNAQLATFTLSLAVLDAVERVGIEPTSIAGHSLGEYTSLAAAGILGFEEAVQIVCERGEAMQAAADARPGTMAVVAGCDSETVDIACRLADGEVWVANMNSADETVIAGDADDVARAGAIALDLGARRLHPLVVGGAFHTPYMAPARDRLRKVLATTDFRDADIPVVANVDSRVHRVGSDWPALLSAQLCSPVRWRQSILRLGGLAELTSTHADSGNLEQVFVELGPGTSLATMITQTLPGASVVTLSKPEDLDRLVDVLSGESPLHSYAVDHQGEQLYVSERLVISPAQGVFEPVEMPPAPGSAVSVGTLLGTVSGVEVLSPFDGTLKASLAHPGERVHAGQPIVWLRAS